MRGVLGYSALLDAVLHRVTPTYWYGRAGQPLYEKVDNDAVGVTCALLRRLKRRADADAVRVLLFMQYTWQTIVEEDEPDEDAKKITACATDIGIEVVDHFAELRAIAVANRDALGDLYLKEGDSYGPMSPKGNVHAAELLARAFKRKR